MLLMLLFIWNMIGTLVLTPALSSVLVFAKTGGANKEMSPA
ncbi:MULTISPECIES: hypothetical protein [unclassified Pseudomonas]|nr:MULTISPECIES: hypothetical protein [unclassified Pseudomonas]